MATLSVNVTSFVDARQRIAVSNSGLVVLCSLIVAIDGFDTAAIGFIAPAIRAEWGCGARHSLAPLFGAGLAGPMVGAFLFGPLADRIRRKRVLALVRPVLLVAAEPGLQRAQARIPVARVAAIPDWVGTARRDAQCGDAHLQSIAPAARRSFMGGTTRICGFTVGSGARRPRLRRRHGRRFRLAQHSDSREASRLSCCCLLLWRQVAGVARASWSWGKRRRAGQADALAHGTGIGSAQTRVSLVSEKPSGFPISHLFEADLHSWQCCCSGSAFFMSLLVIYLLSSWLPTLINDHRVSLKTASIVTAMFQVGGTRAHCCLGG